MVARARTSPPVVAGVVAVVTAAVAVFVAAVLPVAAGAATATVPAPPANAPVAGTATGLPTPPIDTALCPWLASAMAAGDTPAALAELVVGAHDPAEKFGEIVLVTSGDYENVNAGVARLCIPSLTLQDGPWGLAFGDTGVTQLPVPLAIGATFDTDGRAAVRRGASVPRPPARGSTSVRARTSTSTGCRPAAGPTSPTARTRC